MIFGEIEIFRIWLFGIRTGNLFEGGINCLNFWKDKSLNKAF